jgi:hypothetical protein
MTRPAVTLPSAAPGSAGRLVLPPLGDRELALAAPLGTAGPAWALCAPRDLRESHGVEITLGRLEEMANSYDPERVEAAPLNYDHWRGGDAHGWIERLWVADGILWGAPRDLSTEARAKVQTGAVRRVSCEIDLKHDLTGGWYLTGVALLGSIRPAIKGLPPIALAASDPSAPPEPQSQPPEHRRYLWLGAASRLVAIAPALPPTTFPEAAEPAADPAPADPGTGTTLQHQETTMPTAPTPSGAPGTQPAATSQTELAATPAPAVDLAEQQQRLAVMLAQAEATTRELRLRQAALDVDAALAGPLRGRITPAQLRAAVGGVTLRDALVQLRASEQPPTVELAAKEGRPAASAGLYDVLLAALSAAPAFAPLGQPATAIADPAQADGGDDRTPEQRETDRALGLSDEQAIATRRRHAARLSAPDVN